jgi:hypothetical protein
VPYFKCVPCKFRVSATDADPAPTGGACPSCGMALEPVADLTELVGFRSPDLIDSSVLTRGAERVADISGGRSVARAQVEIDRWLDEGGSYAPEPLPEAVALELPVLRDPGHAH